MNDIVESEAPGQSFNLIILRASDHQPAGTEFLVVHEEFVLSSYYSELALLADQFLKLYDGDGYLIRRGEVVA